MFRRYSRRSSEMKARRCVELHAPSAYGHAAYDFTSAHSVLSSPDYIFRDGPGHTATFADSRLPPDLYKSPSSNDYAYIQVDTTQNFTVFCEFDSNCPTLTAKVTSGKRLSQCRERVFKQNVFSLRLKMLECCFRSSMGKTALVKLQPSCQWFITVSPGRSETHSVRDICGSSNEIRQIRWTIAVVAYFMSRSWPRNYCVALAYADDTHRIVLCNWESPWFFLKTKAPKCT